MSSTTLDGSSTPFLIAPGTIEQANDGDGLFLLGTIDNQGTIFANGTGTASAANLVSIVVAGPAVTLEGGGTLLLAGGFDSQVYGSTSARESLVNVNNTIEGLGDIGVSGPVSLDPGNTAYPIAFTNEAAGVIDGNGTVVAAPMTLPPTLFISTGAGALVNDGLMEATGIDGLIFDSATIDQSGGGTLLADGADVASEYVGVSDGITGGVDIIGGTLAAIDGGAISLTGATLDGSATPVVIGSGVDFTEQSLQAILGRIDNLGTIDMTGAANGIGNIFLASPTVTLGGTGEVLDPTLTGSGGAVVALVNVANTIAGFGQIGMITIDNTAFGPLGGTAPVAVTNEAAGVIDATGTEANQGGGGLITGDAIYLYGGAAPLVNDGLIEATGIGGLDIADSTLDQSGGGTLLANGAGVAVYLQNVDLTGGDVETDTGGLIDFNGGANTLTSGPGPVVIGAGGSLEVSSFVSTGTLTLDAATIDNLGSLIDAASMLVGGAALTLTGGGAVQLSGVLSAPGTASLVNLNNDIAGGSIAGASLAMSNAAGGTIDATELDIGATLTNAGLLQDVNVGAAIVTTIDNIGTGNLLATTAITLDGGAIVGGTLAADGGKFFIGSDGIAGGVTLDGRAAPVTVEAGTTVQDYFNEISLPFTFEASGNLTLVGTIDLAGTLIGANPETIESGGYTIPNAGLLVGAGAIDGYVANTGTLLAQGGTMTVTGDVTGSGGIAIAPGAAFVLGGVSGETVDFEAAPNDVLMLNTPTAFTGTLANLTYGDVIGLGTDDIQSAMVVGGNTLVVTLTDSSTFDYALSNLAAGTRIVPGPVSSDVVVACFAEGTRILAADGERRVETLRVGDMVATATGGMRRIVWTGHRRIDCLRHRWPHDVQPVRVRAHAFGPDVPHADLRLSPDHAVFVGGELIPVRHLVNGATVLREAVAAITYWHVELDAHDAVLAENLPCESYLNTGNRGAFVEPAAVVTPGAAVAARRPDRRRRSVR